MGAIPHGNDNQPSGTFSDEAIRPLIVIDALQTRHELLDRLQAEHPGIYPDALLRTVQRRLKIWRGEAARALVLAPMITQSNVRLTQTTRMLPSCSSGASS